VSGILVCRRGLKKLTWIWVSDVNLHASLQGFFKDPNEVLILVLDSQVLVLATLVLVRSLR